MLLLKFTQRSDASDPLCLSGFHFICIQENDAVVQMLKRCHFDRVVFDSGIRDGGLEKMRVRDTLVGIGMGSL